MKQLLIIANPWKNSFSRAMLEAYEKRIKKQNVSYEIIDLYAENNDFLRYENQKELGERELSAYQKKILEAEELVLFFPVWWSSLPAILKNFFDNNFVAGFAYKYNEKWIPEKLLNWKKSESFLYLWLTKLVLCISWKSYFWDKFKEKFKKFYFRFLWDKAWRISSFRFYEKKCKSLRKIRRNFTKNRTKLKLWKIFYKKNYFP